MTVSTARFDSVLAGFFLVLALVLAYPLGNIAAYGLMLATLVAVGRVLVTRSRPWVAGDWSAPLLVLAFLLLTAAFAFENVAYAYNFLMFLLFAPVSALLARAAAPGNSVRVAVVALLGAVVATGLAVFQVFVLGDKRAPSYFSDPIWSAQAAVICGYLAAIGIVAVNRLWRFVFLLGPLLATLVTLLAGSRGPLLAVPPMLLIIAVVGSRRPWRALLFTTVAVALLVGAALLVLPTLWPYGYKRLTSLPSVLTEIFAGGKINERSTRQRLAFYTSSWSAFQASPWVGYGWGGKMQAIVPYLADKGKMLREGHHHLHSDILDFGVSAGVVGLIAYVLTLAAPLAGAASAPPDGQARARQLGIALLVVGYFVCGLTYLTFGYEYHTTLYVVLAAILVGYCRDAPPTRALEPPLSA